ncbi:DinB family protein [Telmatocola sphagniphila]|uniref:DinB family protein n=1 Tax=Telmatocola sphagniphila TaxID=1123043 RepID=A0A8E6B7X7_9BACT|nr:DinB family protein [Telmatocola sphagniphila]QVL33002.1 DinB family protein [Telmatocola sphagniphila]
MSSPINTTLFRYMMGLTQKVFAEIPEEQTRTQPTPAINPPIWVIGHLCMAWDGALALLGGTKLCPQEYTQWFGPGSNLADMPKELPSKKEMLAQLSQISEMILTALNEVSPQRLEKPNPSRFFNKELPTVRDFVENLLFSHHALHLGQLSIWCKLMNLPKVINF